MASQRIPFEDIEIDKNFTNSRFKVEKDKLEELIDNIALFGLMQPIAVRKVKLDTPETKSDGSTSWTKYYLIFGFRRYAAIKAIRAKKKAAYDEHFPEDKVKCETFDVPFAEALLMNLTENVQREALTEVEIAQAVETIQSQEITLPDGSTTVLKTSEIAAKLGKSVNWIQKLLAFRKKSSDQLRDAVHAGTITLSDGIAIAKNNEPEDQVKAARELAKARRQVPGTGKEARAEAREAVRKKKAEVTGKVHRPGASVIKARLESSQLWQSPTAQKVLGTIYKFVLGQCGENAIKKAETTIADLCEAYDLENGQMPKGEEATAAAE